jgi:hypothetical protein
LNCCESVSQVVDDALKSAAVSEAQMKTSKEPDEKFKMAIDALTRYEKEYHFKMIVVEIMAEAEANDKSSMKVKEELPVREGLQVTFAFVIY